jgi:hypothetical protein
LKRRNCYGESLEEETLQSKFFCTGNWYDILPNTYRVAEVEKYPAIPVSDTVIRPFRRCGSRLLD